VCIKLHQNVETLVPWLLRHSIAGDQLVYSQMFIPHESRLPDTVTKTLLHVAADLFILGSHDSLDWFKGKFAAKPSI
jgi:hypothetical protein